MMMAVDYSVGAVLGVLVHSLFPQNLSCCPLVSGRHPAYPLRHWIIFMPSCRAWQSGFMCWTHLELPRGKSWGYWLLVSPWSPSALLSDTENSGSEPTDVLPERVEKEGLIPGLFKPARCWPPPISLPLCKWPLIWVTHFLIPENILESNTNYKKIKELRFCAPRVSRKLCACVVS